MHTKIFSMFQIISKLPAVKSCVTLSELPGTEFEGSVVQYSQEMERNFPFLVTMVVPINGAAWSAMCKAR